MILNFQKNIDTLKSMSINHANTNDGIISVQLPYGKMLESNLIQAINYCTKDEKVIIQKCPTDFDVLFGADFKIHFLCPMNMELHNQAIYVDISLDKSNLQHGLLYNKGNPLCVLDNGLLLHIGVKTNHCNLFRYKKPCVYLVLSCDGDVRNSPMFTRHDVHEIVRNLRHACMYITLREVTHMKEKMVSKYGSNIIELNPDKFIQEKILGGD